MITYNGRPVIELVWQGHINVDDMVLCFLTQLFDHHSIAHFCGERFVFPSIGFSNFHIIPVRASG